MEKILVGLVEIFETEDFDSFKYYLENRDINESNVAKLVKNIDKERRNLTPVIVSPDKYVIDGQHRIEACRRLKIPVRFIEVKDYQVKNIKDINSASKSWSKDDYINYNSVHNNSRTYKWISEAIKDYNTSSVVVCEALSLTQRQIIDGKELEDISFMYAKRILMQYNAILKYIHRNTKGKRLLVKAIKKLNKISNYSFERMIDSLDKYSFEVVRNQHISSEQVAFDVLVSIYNRNSRGKNKLEVEGIDNGIK
jgi:succinate dehydrogenase flavin-adding protein (antitoxin of CptAB toxin-antitoxin module)